MQFPGDTAENYATANDLPVLLLVLRDLLTSGRCGVRS